jgi:hypothetical protein
LTPSGGTAIVPTEPFLEMYITNAMRPALGDMERRGGREKDSDAIGQKCVKKVSEIHKKRKPIRHTKRNSKGNDILRTLKAELPSVQQLLYIMTKDLHL